MGSDLHERHRRIMGDGAPLFYDAPVELVRGEGVWLEAVDGRRYLDLYNNVPCVGHANPRVAAAMADQAGRLNVHSRYLHDNVIDYAEQLVGLHHDGIESLVVACSGTEATETALTMARAVTGHRGVIGTDATYHGNSSLVGRMSWLPVGADRGEHVRSISTPQTYRPFAAAPDGEPLSGEELCARHLDELEATIASLQESGAGVAALMLCSILANEGLPNPPGDWYREATQLVRDAGGLIIADEVQAGFGRSGRWWGYETSGFVPDIVCMGKPMGNGMPLSAVASSHANVSAFRAKHRYFNTFAGSPLQAAAGQAVLDEIHGRDLVSSVARVGEGLRTALGALAHEHPSMGDVRGTGLFIGVDWVVPGTTEPDVAGAAAMVEALKDRGVLLGKAGQHGNVIKIRPPLVFDQEHAAIFLDAFRDALDQVTRA
ncbi:MAG: aminotransferase class III-fold pyridoxal phosphate-dependent enzyme [Actinomycetota bacterium]